MIWHNRRWALPNTIGEFLLVAIPEGKDEPEYGIVQLDMASLAEANRKGKLVFEEFGGTRVLRWSALAYAKEFEHSPQWAYTFGTEYFGADTPPKPGEQVLTVVRIDRQNGYPLYRHYIQTTVVGPDGQTVFDKAHQDQAVHTISWAHLPPISEEPDLLRCDNCRHKGKGKICGVHGYLMYKGCQDYRPEGAVGHAKV